MRNSALLALLDTITDRAEERLRIVEVEDPMYEVTGIFGGKVSGPIVAAIPDPILLYKDVAGYNLDDGPLRSPVAS